MATNTWRHQQQTHPHLKANCMLQTDIAMSKRTHPAGVGDAWAMRTTLAGAGVAVRDVGGGRAALQGRGLVGREGVCPAGRVSHGGWRRHRRGGKGTGPCGREGGRHVGSILSSRRRHLTNRQVVWTNKAQWSEQTRHSGLNKQGTVVWTNKAQWSEQTRHSGLNKQGTVVWTNKAQWSEQTRHSGLNKQGTVVWTNKAQWSEQTRHRGLNKQGTVVWTNTTTQTRHNGLKNKAQWSEQTQHKQGTMVWTNRAQQSEQTQHKQGTMVWTNKAQ